MEGVTCGGGGAGAGAAGGGGGGGAVESGAGAWRDGDGAGAGRTAAASLVADLSDLSAEFGERPVPPVAGAASICARFTRNRQGGSRGVRMGEL